jgi:outer membrane protein assembly factor BamB
MCLACEPGDNPAEQAAGKRAAGEIAAEETAGDVAAPAEDGADSDGTAGDGNGAADQDPAQGPQGHDWPTFRGNQPQTGVARTVLPGKLKLLWDHDTESSYLKSTAAIVGDTAYIGTDEGHVIALNLENGERRWTYDTDDIIEAAPGYNDGRVFVGDLYGVFHCVDAKTGELVWKHETDGKIISSANFHGENVLVGSWDYFLYCFDQATGEVRWTFENPAQVNCSPCIAGDIAAISGCDGALHLIDLKTGEEKMSLPLAGYVAASAAYRDGHYYVPSYEGEMVAATVDDGELETVWTEMGGGQNVAFYASPAVTEEFAIFGDRSGAVRCLNREDGEEVWLVQTEGEVDSSPVVSGEHVFVGSSDGNLYALQLADGEEVWRFQTGAGIYSSPAVGRNRLIIGADDGIVYCFGPEENEE